MSPYSSFEFVLLDQQGKVLSDTDPVDVSYMSGDKKQSLLNACVKLPYYSGAVYKSYMSSKRIAELNWTAGVQTFYLEVKGDVDTLYYEGKQSPVVVRFNGKVAEKYNGQLYLLKR